MEPRIPRLLLLIPICLPLLACNTGSSPKNGAGSINSQAQGNNDDHGNDANNATPIIAFNTPLNGTIEIPSDQDFFSIDLTVNLAYTFRTITQGDTNLHLIDTDGTTILKTNDDENQATGQLNSLIVHTATKTGTHYLVVQQGPNNTLGTPIQYQVEGRL